MTLADPAPPVVGEGFFESLVQSAGTVLAVCDGDGLIRWASTAVGPVLGYEPSAVVGTSPFAIVHPDDRAGAQEAFARVLATPGGVAAVECRLRSADGWWHHVEINAVNMLDHPSIAGVRIAARDVSATQRALEALHWSELRYRAVVDLSPDAVFIVQAGRIAYANAAAVALLGVASSDDLAGGPLTQWVPAGDRDEVTARVARLEGGRVSLGPVEERIERADGFVRDVEVASSPIVHEGGPAVLRVYRDISRRKQGEEAMRAAKDAAEAANMAKSQFLSRMSHELRTPLNAVLGFAQLLQFGDLDDEQTEATDHILRAGKHLLGLIDEILDIARIEEGRLRLSVEPVAVSPVVDDAVALVVPMAAQAGIRIDARPPGGDPPFVRADLQRMKQVLLNLLSNAVKYNRPGGSVTVTCTVPAPGRVRLAVADTGNGLTEDELGRLFQPFERLSAAASGIDGVGIGLALSKKLVEVMGGEIGVRSSLGEGTVFWFELDAAEDPVSGLGDLPATRPALLPDGHPRLTVLYVEDNASNAQLVDRALARRAEVDLVTVAQGGLGLELARSRHVDLVLLDLDLPDMNGLEVLERLKAEASTASIPVVVVSADASRSRMQQAHDRGADDYLTKPLQLQQLYDVVDRLAS